MSAILGAILLSGCSGVAWPTTVTIAVPDRASANVSIAAQGDDLVVVWGAATDQGATDIYTAVSRDSGDHFSAPVRVSGADANVQISGEQPPRVALVPGSGREPSMVVVWTAKSSIGTRLVTARSDDGGKSFGSATTVPGSDAPGNRGWEAIATRPDGRVVAVWLDHRETVPQSMGPGPMQHEGMAHVGHAAASSDGAARAELSKLYVGNVDGSEPPRVVTGGVCYCCKTALAAGPDGALFAAWRHVYPGNLRDIAFTLSRDGGLTFAPPIRVSEDKWVLDGCPENGPAMAIDSGNRIHLVWATRVASTACDGEATLGLFYATSKDGAGFSPRQRLTTAGTPYHPQIALGSGGALVIAWDELADGRRRAVVARGSVAAPETGFVREEIPSAVRASYPVVASTRGGFVVAWTDSSRTPSQIAVQRLP